MYRIVVTTAVGHTYARNPDDTVFVCDHALEAEAFAELFYLGHPDVRAVAIVNEAWPQKLEQMRRDLAAGLPLPKAS